MTFVVIGALRDNCDHVVIRMGSQSNIIQVTSIGSDQTACMRRLV